MDPMTPMPLRSSFAPPFATPLALSVLAAVLAGCAATASVPTTPASAPANVASPSAAAAAPGSGTPAAAPGARPAGPPPAPGTPAPFAEVTKDAKSSAGFLAVWTKDEKTWLEIPAERIDKPFFLGSSLASGLGERFFLPGLMGREHVVVLRRHGNQVQLVARNLHARAPEGTPLARALAESYSDSLLAAAPLAAAPHPERKSLLVDATALLGGDLGGVQTLLETAYRMPYALDRGNSAIERARTSDAGTAITFRSHYSVPKLPAPPVLAPGAPPPNPAALPNPPRTVPDARSLFLSFTYTLAPLPATAMTPRVADQRVGYFTDAYLDFTADDTSPDRRRHVINRWRLEKKDPAAAVSEPKEPIRVVMDRNIPERWRATVREGILEWNQAFERAGFANALVVEQQPDDADWTSFEGTRMLAVRWFAMEGPGATAIGPSQSDPRTGEILRGAAIIPENRVRFDRSFVTDVQPRLGAAAAPGEAWAGPDGSADPVAGSGRNALGEFAPRLLACTYAQDALEQAAFGIELLALRGAIDPEGPEARRFVAGGLKAVVVHEVGHAIGLRHNFKASTGVTQAQLRDPSFTARRGISNSVMDYNPPNLPLASEPVADYHMPGLGAYDYWAIEYGYREFAPADEKAELAKLAAQGDRDPGLAYGPDEDAAGPDPRANRFDLGEDPLAYAQRQLRLARELWARTQARELAPEDDLTVFRRNLELGFNRVGQAVPLLTRYVGGVYTSRALAGAGQPLLAPVPAARQRAALDVLLGELFSSASFRLEPRFMSRLGVNHLDLGSFGRPPAGPDFSLAGTVATLQRGALDALMSDALAARLADAEVKVDDPRTLLSYAEVQARLRGAVWSELKDGAKAGEIDSLRRNLQREHAKRLAAGLLRPASPVAADVRAVHRQEAGRLEADLKAALAAKGWSATARAHLADSQVLLAEALKAPLAKQGV
jgi:hypothetical protein